METAAKRRRGSPSAVASTSDKENRFAGNGCLERKRTVEEIYQKKTQLEHILLRPDSYVGSTEQQSQDHWVLDESSGRMVRRKLEFVPALYKIFDEIVVNAADNLVRCPSQDEIRIEVKPSQGCITVYNNGSGLPVQQHKEHKCYVPELVFGHLLTGDNYDDSEKKVTGGRNGYGAKLTNIFSTRFILETQHSPSGKRYKQVWEKNMTVCKPPEVKPAQGKDFTQVTFYPDLKRFQMSSLEPDIVALMRRRAYDVAAATHGRCKVTLDGKMLEVKSFEDYVALHLQPDAFRVCEVINDRWEVAVGLTDGSGFQQVSFVNAICTSRGGTHVNYVGDQIVNAVLERVSKQKNSGPLAVKAANVRGYLWIFVNCLIENAAFDSQTKETLTSKRDRFGSECELPEAFVGAVLESGLLEVLQEWSQAMSKSELAQHLNRGDCVMQKRLHGIPKLEDANKAGTKESGDCTLILTEGDSAKALAVAGFSVIGRDYYGVFPLRGKLRNVRELTVKQMLENKEIEQLLRILALDASKEYADAKGLRYGSIMIMTDQDFDGSHIKGLIINFVEKWFPSLLKVPGFLKEFVTPIVKVSKGDTSQTFFTIPEYETWKEENDGGRGWKSKYYKGLGTSTSKEAKDYFSDLANHEIKFAYTGEGDNGLIDMAFNPKRADDRKVWISQCEDGTCVDHTQTELTYSDFVERELVLYAKYDVERMIPSMVDGLKVGQRKVMFGAFKKKISTDIKVAQLSGYVAEHSAYHHGEMSLQGTIIGLAQTFVGSNNLNVLVPSGQFGTRLQGGKDHAAARYIFTRLSRTARCIFPEEDDVVLENLEEEGLTIEPKWYCPVIPLVLVNGADGIGTGWSTSVPNHNPRDVIANVRRALAKEALEPMTPWYRGFRGSITPTQGTPGKFDVLGKATRRGRMRLEITELPVRRWTQDYKEWLVDQLPSSADDRRAHVQEMREHHTENSVHFVLSMLPDKLAEAERRGVERVFHLRSTISTTNMHLFDAEGKLKKYNTAEEIIEDFVPVRLEVYGRRKEHLLAKLARELAVISNRYRFVKFVVTDQLKVESRKTAELCKQMQKLGLQTMREISGVAEQHGPPPPEELAGPQGFKYLISMKMWTLTDEKMDELSKLNDTKMQELEELRGTSLETLWERDLARLEDALDACDREDAKEAELAAKMALKATGDNSLVNQQCVLVLSRNFRAKRLPTSEWKTVDKGSQINKGRSLVDKKAKKAAGAEGDDAGDDCEEEEGEDATDALAGVFCCFDFDALLVFSEHGQVFMLQALDVPLAKKMSAQGTPLSEFLPELGDKSSVTALITVPHQQLKNQNDQVVVLVTAKGMAKKVPLDRFRGLRPGKGIPAMTIAQGDKLCWAHRASTNCALVLVTQQGSVSRIALRPWQNAMLKSAGRIVMKMRGGDHGGDCIASTSIHEMSAREIAASVGKRRPDPAAAAGPSDSAVAGGAEGEVGAAPAAGEQNASTRNGLAEDDDSDQEQGAADAPGEEEEDDEGGESDDAGGEEREDAEDAKESSQAAAEGSQAAAESGSQAAAESGTVDADADCREGGAADVKANDAAIVAGAAKQDERCVLLVTEMGMGMRIPLSTKRLGLSRAGKCGKRAIKLHDGAQQDKVVSVCVVSGSSESGKPEPPRRPFDIWYAENKATLSASDTSALAGSSDDVTKPALADGSEAAPSADTQEGSGRGKVQHLLTFHRMRDMYRALPEDQQQVYVDRADEDRQRYLREMVQYQARQSEEILLGSRGGLVKRTNVSAIPIFTRVGRGKLIARCPKGDRLCAASLLSSMDVDRDQAEGTDAAKGTAAAGPPAPRPPPPQRLGSRRAVASRAPPTATPTPAGPSSAAPVAKEAFDAPAPGTPVRNTSAAGGAGTHAGPDAPLPPLSLTPPGDAKLAGSCRRGEKARARVSTPPWLGVRARLSHLCMSPRPPTLGAMQTCTSKLVRESKLKPKIRQLGKLRTIMVTKQLDVAEWARFATEASQRAWGTIP